MKRMVAVLSTLLLLTLFCIPTMAMAADTGGLRYTVTVNKFENKAGWAGQWDLGDAWGLVMTDVLNQTGRFIVLGETDMRNAAMNEQDLGASGRTAQGGKTPVIGQLTPAQILVKGAITHVAQNTSNNFGGISIGGISLGGSQSTAEVNVTMYMVDSTTGQILASTSVVGKSNSGGSVIGYSGAGWSGGLGNFKKDNVGKAVEEAVSKGVKWMIGQLPSIQWRGSVVMAKDGNIYINRGSREGVKNGQIFVVGRSEIIRDPSTGEVLDESVQEVAQIEVSSLKEKLSICTIVSGDPDAITSGMMVKQP